MSRQRRDFRTRAAIPSQSTLHPLNPVYLGKGIDIPQRMSRRCDEVTTTGSAFPIPPGGSPRQNPYPESSLGVLKSGDDGICFLALGSLCVVVVETEAATAQGGCRGIADLSKHVFGKLGNGATLQGSDVTEEYVGCWASCFLHPCVGSLSNLDVSDDPQWLHWRTEKAITLCVPEYSSALCVGKTPGSSDTVACGFVRLYTTQMSESRHVV